MKSDTIESVNNVVLLQNEVTKTSIYSYNGVKIKVKVKYARYGIDISKWNETIDWEKVKTDTLPAIYIL